MLEKVITARFRCFLKVKFPFCCKFDDLLLVKSKIIERLGRSKLFGLIFDSFFLFWDFKTENSFEVSVNLALGRLLLHNLCQNSC